jgi:DNA-binding transcriptional LysR family regulator
MNFDEVESFVAVVRAGSFASAAKLRCVPKSTLTRSLDRLEQALGSTLIQRSSRKLDLTPLGRVFFERVEPHVRGVSDAIQAALDDKDEPTGLLRVTAPSDLGDAFLGEWVVAFSRRYPKIRVEVALSPNVIDLIGEGFDLAVRAATTIEDGRLIARKLGRSWMYLYASPAYLMANGVPLSPQDLAQHTCILFRPPAKSTASTWRLSNGSEELHVRVSGPLSGTEISFVRSVIRAGAGIGFLPFEVTGRDVRDGKLVRVLPEWSMPSAQLFCVYPASRQIPRKTAVFRDFLIEMFRTRFSPVEHE